MPTIISILILCKTDALHPCPDRDDFSPKADSRHLLFFVLFPVLRFRLFGRFLFFLHQLKQQPARCFLILVTRDEDQAVFHHGNLFSVQNGGAAG